MNSKNFGSGKGGLGTNSQRSFSSGSKQPLTFWGRLAALFRLAQNKSILFYRQFKTLLWVGTTGFIFLVAPFAFSHFLEISEELQQISRQGAEGVMATQRGSF